MTKLVGVQDYRYKIVVIGAAGSGKTSIIKRFVLDEFSMTSESTVGVDFVYKVIENSGSKIHLSIWDVAGQERFGGITNSYYRNAVGALLIFDITQISTWEQVDLWKDDLIKKIESPIPILLLANKCDLLNEIPSAVSDDQIKNWVDLHRDQGVVGWNKTSAKTKENIEGSFEFLVIENVFSPMNKEKLNELKKGKKDVIIIDKRRDKNVSKKLEKCEC